MSPASRARSTAASVWPARWSTPPGFARSGKTWPGWTMSCGALGRVDRDLDRVRAVVGGDAGRDALAGLDRDGEGGSVRRLVALGHHPQPELVAALAGEAEADQPAALLRHEVDRLGRRELRGDGQVALVLAVGRVDDDDHLALPDVLDRLLDRGERALGRNRRSAHRFIVDGSSRSTYFASTSASRLTSSPGSSAPSVVSVERVRDQRDGEAGVVERRDGERRAVDGDRALLDAVAEHVRRRVEPDPAPVALRLDRADAADAVDVALHDVAAERLARPERRLDVHRGARLEPTERGAAQASPGRRRRRAASRRPRPR